MVKSSPQNLSNCDGLMGKGTSGNLLEDVCKSMLSANDTLHFVTEYSLRCKGGITEGHRG
jgi:hypothetical protein